MSTLNLNQIITVKLSQVGIDAVLNHESSYNKEKTNATKHALWRGPIWRMAKIFGDKLGKNNLPFDTMNVDL